MANVGAPQVNYRESINKSFELRYVHKKQSGGSGQFADIALRFEPGEAGSGFEFINEIKGGVVPKEYIPAISKGLSEMMGSGVLAGFPVVDVKATLYDGSYHDVDSSALAFEIAAKAAFREGLPKCNPRILEPIMKACTPPPCGPSICRSAPSVHPTAPAASSAALTWHPRVDCRRLTSSPRRSRWAT